MPFPCIGILLGLAIPVLLYYLFLWESLKLE